jgi:hypothetical protein
MFAQNKHHRASEFGPTTASTSLEGAAGEFLRRGWSFIPLSGKLPAIPSWKEYQSRLPNSAELKTWFSGPASKATGIGIVTGNLSRLVVVDCDSLNAVAYWQEHFPSSPLVVQTGRGGIHIYYQATAAIEIRNRAKIFGLEIDILGEGGYATAPPSLHSSGKFYVWQSYDASVTLPEFDAAWLVDKTKQARLPKSVETGQVRHAANYIRRIRATAGEGGHNATYRAACKLRDAGLSEDEALAMLTDWNETNATPPWSAADLLHKIRSAFEALTR